MLQPDRLLSDMPMVRSLLNDDIKQAICKLDYLGMTVGEALCHYHNAFSLKEVATLNTSEQHTLFVLGTALAALFKWRESAVHQELLQLFEIAASGSCAGDVGAHGTARLCPSTGVQAATDSKECPPGLSSKANFLASKEPHWELLCMRGADTAITRRLEDLGTALSKNLISEEAVDKVLRALLESQQLAAASTCCAATAVMEMDGMVVPPGPPKETKPNAHLRRIQKRAAQEHAAQNQPQPVLVRPAEQLDSEAAAAAADPSAEKPLSPEELENHLAAKAAKRVVRDVFLWRVAGELSGFDSRHRLDAIMEKYRLSVDAKAQLLTGFTNLCSTMGIKPQQTKKGPKKVEASEPSMT